MSEFIFQSVTHNFIIFLIIWTDESIVSEKYYLQLNYYFMVNFIIRNLLINK